MRQALRAWPFAVAILCLIYDTKWVLLLLLWCGASTVWLYGVPMGTGVAELLYWNWFMGWFPHWAKEQEKAREAFHDFWDNGFGSRFTRLWPKLKDLALWVWDWALVRWNRMFNSDSKYKRWLGRFVLWFFKTMPKMLAYPLIAFLGIWPGGFLLAIPLCKTHKVPLGLIILLSSSMFSNWIMVEYGVSAIKWLFGS